MAAKSWPAVKSGNSESSDDDSPPGGYSHGGPQSIGVLPAPDFSYPSWLPNTNSYVDFPVYGAQDEHARQDNMSADLKFQAEQLDKQAAALKAHAQNCRDMAEMQDLSQSIGGPDIDAMGGFFPPPMVHGGYGGPNMPGMPPGMSGMPPDWMKGMPPGMAGMPPGMPPGMSGMAGMPPGMPGMPRFQPPFQAHKEQPRGRGPTASTASSGSSAGPSITAGAGPGAGKTTVMWRNIPNNLTRDGLLHLIDSVGFQGTYDFFYSPVDFTSSALVGYAFINFVTSSSADQFYTHFQGFTDWSLKSEKVSEVTWSHPLQGLEGHIERYRNSPVMHPAVSEDRRPLLFDKGKIIVFPPPTRKIRAPHLKECRPGKEGGKEGTKS